MFTQGPSGAPGMPGIPGAKGHRVRNCSLTINHLYITFCNFENHLNNILNLCIL